MENKQELLVTPTNSSGYKIYITQPENGHIEVNGRKVGSVVSLEPGTINTYSVVSNEGYIPLTVLFKEIETSCWIITTYTTKINNTVSRLDYKFIMPNNDFWASGTTKERNFFKVFESSISSVTIQPGQTSWTYNSTTYTGYGICQKIGPNSTYPSSTIGSIINYSPDITINENTNLYTRIYNNDKSNYSDFSNITTSEVRNNWSDWYGVEGLLTCSSYEGNIYLSTPYLNYTFGKDKEYNIYNDTISFVTNSLTTTYPTTIYEAESFVFLFNNFLYPNKQFTIETTYSQTTEPSIDCSNCYRMSSGLLLSNNDYCLNGFDMCVNLSCDDTAMFTRTSIINNTSSIVCNYPLYSFDIQSDVDVISNIGRVDLVFKYILPEYLERLQIFIDDKDNPYPSPWGSTRIRMGESMYPWTIYPIKGENIIYNDDNTITVKCSIQFPCISVDAEITLADGSTKLFGDLTIDDEVLVWNFDECKYDTAKLLTLQPIKEANRYYVLTTSSGKQIKLIGDMIHTHRVFSVEKSRFEYPQECIGDTIYTEDGYETLVSGEFIEEPIKYRNAISYKHINLFANRILTSCRLNNIYPIKDMKFIKEDREIKSKEEFNLPDCWYYGARLGEQTLDTKDLISYCNMRNTNWEVNTKL